MENTRNKRGADWPERQQTGEHSERTGSKARDAKHDAQGLNFKIQQETTDAK